MKGGRRYTSLLCLLYTGNIVEDACLSLKCAYQRLINVIFLLPVIDLTGMFWFFWTELSFVTFFTLKSAARKSWVSIILILNNSNASMSLNTLDNAIILEAFNDREQMEWLSITLQ